MSIEYQNNDGAYWDTFNSSARMNLISRTWRHLQWEIPPILSSNGTEITEWYIHTRGHPYVEANEFSSRYFLGSLSTLNCRALLYSCRISFFVHSQMPSKYVMEQRQCSQSLECRTRSNEKPDATALQTEYSTAQRLLITRSLQNITVTYRYGYLSKE